MLPPHGDTFPTTLNVVSFHTTKIFVAGEWRWLLGTRDVTGCVGFTICRITSVNHDIYTNRITIALHDGTSYYTFTAKPSAFSFTPTLHTMCTFYFQIVPSHYHDHIMVIDLVPIASQDPILWAPQSDVFCSALLEHWKQCVQYYLTHCHPPHNDYPIPSLPTPYHFIHNEAIDFNQILRKLRPDGGPHLGYYLEYCGVDITNRLIYTTPRVGGGYVCPLPSKCESVGSCNAVEPILYKLQINKSPSPHCRPYTINVSTRFPPTHNMTIFDHKFMGNSNLNGEQCVESQCYQEQQKHNDKQDEKEEEEEQQQPSQALGKFDSPRDDPDGTYMDGSSDGDDAEGNDKINENGFVYLHPNSDGESDGGLGDE